MEMAVAIASAEALNFMEWFPSRQICDAPMTGKLQFRDTAVGRCGYAVERAAQFGPEGQPIGRAKPDISSPA